MAYASPSRYSFGGVGKKRIDDVKYRHFGRACLAVITGIWLAGCASVPLSALWHMSGFSKDDIGTLNPAELRVALLLPDPVTMKPGGERLLIKAFHHAGDNKPALAVESTLEQTAEGRTIPLDVPAAEPGRHWALFQMRPDDYAEFARFQTAFREQGDSLHSLNLKVHFELGPESRDRKAITFSTWLKMKHDESPFELLHNSTLHFDRDNPID